MAHTLQHFVEGVEAVAAYLGMMGMELNPRKCAMVTTEGSWDCSCAFVPTWKTHGTEYQRRTLSPT